MDSAVAQEDDFAIEQEGFFDVVADGEDGDATAAESGPQVGEDLVAEGAVYAGEWFVEEEEPAVGTGIGAGEVDALALAAGKLGREAAAEGVEAEEGEGLGDEAGACRGGVRAVGELDVFEHSEVREERGLLGSPAEGALLGRDEGGGGLEGGRRGAGVHGAVTGEGYRCCWKEAAGGAEE